MILRSSIAITLTIIMLSNAYDQKMERVENGGINNLNRNEAPTEPSALMKLISHIQNEIDRLKQEETPSDYQDGVFSQENNVFSRVNFLLLINNYWRKLFKNTGPILATY